VSFLSRWFSKSPADLLAKGDRYMESDSFFDARVCYEEGLKRTSGDLAAQDQNVLFAERISAANYKLAGLNLSEAEFAYARGDSVKAIDHLELAKTLTSDIQLRTSVDRLLTEYQSEQSAAPVTPLIPSSCASCSSSSGGELPEGDHHPDDSLPPLEYYDLLIHQLPEDLYHRYNGLGEDFAIAYIAASHDHHHEALSGFDGCSDALPQDIYFYEKGKVLHRLGKDQEAEQLLRSAVEANSAHSLAWINLALIISGTGRYQEALHIIEKMVAQDIMPEQALLLRADILEVTGDHDGAVALYIELLQTPFARTAAEKLYGILLELGREADAAVLFKKYLKKSCH
jgi:tetratricopeptide (TPR) repeat protein